VRQIHEEYVQFLPHTALPRSVVSGLNSDASSRLDWMRDQLMERACCGVRVLSEGPTFGTMAWFKESELNLSLWGGEDQNLSEAVFGLVAGSGEESDETKGLIRRVDPKRYFPDGEIGRFFRYRPWG
jgi:hypothetical protein